MADQKFAFSIYVLGNGTGDGRPDYGMSDVPVDTNVEIVRVNLTLPGKTYNDALARFHAQMGPLDTSNTWRGIIASI